MANVIFNSYKRDIQNANIDLDSDTIKVMLVTSVYTPDQDAPTKRSDVTNEVSVTNDTASGRALADKSVAADNTDNVGDFDADDVNWAN